MSKPGPCEDLMHTNAHLREQVAALSECLREVLSAPVDSFALAKACYVLAKLTHQVGKIRIKQWILRVIEE
ncbi:MAG: hypothetical protein M3120_07235 [Pseudomonadota bacterium]|nr:hypothetical protein [Pseudomonadota bacterium]